MRYDFVISLSTFCLASSFALAADCVSVGGQANGQKVFVERKVTFKGKTMTLSGTFNHQKSPPRSLDCAPLQTGFLCARQFGPIKITVMNNRRRMVETVTDNAGNEVASIAYECEGSLMLR